MKFDLIELGEISNITKLAGYEFTKHIKYLEDGEIIAIRALNVKNGMLDLTDVKRIDRKVSKGLTRSKLYRDEIVLTYTGSQYGDVARIDKNDAYHLAPNVAKVTIDDRYNSYFYFLVLQSPYFQWQLKNFGVGSSQPTIPMKTIRTLKVPLPPIKTQNKIADFFKHIDEKIQLNMSIIDNLNELSSSIFSKWFIDYEFPNEQGFPYRSSGGEMRDSELGKIPAEFRESTFDSLGTIIGGGTPSKKNEEYYTSDGISWITPKDLSNNKNIFIYKGALDITELGLKKGSARLLPENTVLFTSRAPIGYIAIAGKKVTTNQGFKSIVPDKGYSPYFIYHLLKFKLPVIEAAAGGSTFKEISGKGLKEIFIPLPPIKLVNRYKEMVEPLFLQIQTLETENQKLIQLRDILLPKLISGEIAIPKEWEV